MLKLTTWIPAEQVKAAPDDAITLTYALRQRSRQRVALESRREAGLFLPPRTSMREGDQLSGDAGLHIVVHAANERLSCATTKDILLHARACYHLGNRHVSLQVGDGWIRYEPDHVLDEMVRGLGLAVDSISAPFEPERGAYHGHGSMGSHHDLDHGSHSHAPAPAPAHPHTDSSAHTHARDRDSILEGEQKV